MKAWMWIITLIVLALSLGVMVQAVQTPSALGLGPCWVVSVKDGDTITVRLPDDGTMKVRYLGVNAPELSDKEHLGPDAKDANAKLVEHQNVWLELEKKGEGFLRGRDNRVLAYVFLDAARTQLVQEGLVKQGLARIDLRGVTDTALRTDRFPVRYADALIAAQIAAAKNRDGVWGLDDSYPKANLAIAAIKFWGEKEAVYLVNRADKPIELAENWILMDAAAWKSKKEGKRPQHELSFSDFFGPSCVLPPGGILLIYTGPGIPVKMNGKVIGCGTRKVEAYWTRRQVWDNDGDSAYLLGPDGKLYFVYTYPPFQKK